ncbi:MAG: hypothetical protein ACO3NZ_14195 [Pirellulales bacterium]
MIDPTKTHQVLEYKHGKPLLSVRFATVSRSLFFPAENSPLQQLVRGGEGAEPTVSPLDGGHHSWVQPMAVLPDDLGLVTAGYDGRLAWSEAAAEKTDLVRVADAHDGWVHAVAASPDAQLLGNCHGRLSRHEAASR